MRKQTTILSVLIGIFLFSEAANAGQLGIRVTNVNTGEPSQMDHNIVPGPAGTLNIDNPSEVTTEEPLKFTSYRDVSTLKPMNMHLEIEVYDDSGLPTFSGDEVYFVEIDLLGDADPVFKTDISQSAMVRPGTDNTFSEAAEGFPDGEITKAGTNSTKFFLTPSEVSETAIGFILPVALQACGDFDVQISFTVFVGPLGNKRTVSTVNNAMHAASCVGPSIMSTAITQDVTIDLGSVTDPFELFVEHDGLSEKGYSQVNMQNFGVVTFGITNHVLAPKKKTDSDFLKRVVDISDIEEYTLKYQFADGLDGIAALQMVGCGALATLDGDFAFWTLTAAEVEDCFGLGPAVEEGGSQSGEVVLKIFSSEDEPISMQKVSLIANDVTFAMDPSHPDDMFLEQASLQSVIDDAWRLVRSGLNFGPFDWVAAPGRRVQSVFRVTGVPQTPATIPAPPGVILEFSGSVTDIDADFISTPLQIGAPISGSFRFDETRSPSSVSGSGSRYPFDEADIRILGARFASNNANGSIRVRDGLTDELSLSFSLADPSLIISFFDTRDTDGLVFDSEMLSEVVELATSGDLSAFETARIRIDFMANSSGLWGNCGASDCTVLASFDSLTIKQQSAKAPDPYTSGVLLIENTQNGLDGFCEFDLSDHGIFQGELVINPTKFATMIANPECYKAGVGMGPLTEFGRGDITFSFFIPDPDGDKVDMDRLLWSPGDVFADYGDNSNDVVSIKARSCDPGRFGPHVINHLTGRQADLLTSICAQLSL